jgi:hypothetical protein
MLKDKYKSNVNIFAINGWLSFAVCTLILPLDFSINIQQAMAESGRSQSCASFRDFLSQNSNEISTVKIYFDLDCHRYLQNPKQVKDCRELAKVMRDPNTPGLAKRLTAENYTQNCISDVNY